MRDTEQSPDLQQSIAFALQQGVDATQLRDMIWDIGELKLTPDVTIELKNFMAKFSGNEFIIELLLGLPKTDRDQLTQEYVEEYCNLLVLLLQLSSGKS